MIYFETQRLIFRDWKEEDLEGFRMMNKDTEVMEFFPKVLSADESEVFFGRIQDEFKESGYGLYAVETKHNHEFIGYIGFHRATFDADFTPCIEIGWRLKRTAWGHGYATEGAKACLDYGARELNFDQVYSFTANINLRSQNVMTKIGMAKVKEFKHPNVHEDSPLSGHVLYLIHLQQ